VLEPHQRALALVGIPFRFQGRDRRTGLDCIGVIVSAFRLPDGCVARYRISEGSWDLVRDELAPWFTQKDCSRPESNDLAVFRLSRSFHFGIVSGEHLVHADQAIGRVVTRRIPQRLGRDCQLFSYNSD
jgi:hypothetical protein